MHRTRPDVTEACYAIIGAVLVLASGLLVTWGALALYRKGVNTAMDEVAGRVIALLRLARSPVPARQVPETLRHRNGRMT